MFKYDTDDGGVITSEQPLELNGSGGGGKGRQRPSRELADNVRSNAVARFVMAYSVGEVGGLVGDDIRKSIYLDGVPVMRADGDLNFQGITVDERKGTIGQSRVGGFDNASIVTTINTPVTVSGGPIIRAVNSDSIDSARVTISVPSLLNIDKRSGDINGSSFEFRIEVRNALIGGWISRGTYTVDAKSSGPFEASYYVYGPEWPGQSTSAWEIRVIRTSADSLLSNVVNAFNWGTLTQIEETPENYDGVAYIAVSVDTESFGGNIPNISLKVDGVKVKVPVNYTDSITTASYSGTWNGTWKWISTSNPVWHAYNLIINTKYGMGIPEAFLDKYEFYRLAQYCDAVNTTTGAFVGVSDGKGGFRRRFTFNTQIVSNDDALKFLQEMASSFRGLFYYGAGSIMPSQDSPRAISAIITNENVLDGKFVYSGTEAKDRITIANIAFNDEEDFYFPSVVTYPRASAQAGDPGIIRYGRNTYEGAKMGCNNQAEATAFAKWVVYTSQNENVTCQFTVGPEHAVLRPSEIVEVYDRRFTRERFGGRIAAGSSATSINLDAPVELKAGHTYSITIIGNDGYTLVTRAISSGSGVRTAVDVATFGFTPTAGHTWAIKGSDISPQLFRILSIEKKNLLEYEVFSQKYDPAKYAAVESSITLSPPNITRRPFFDLQPPTNVTFVTQGRNDPARGVYNVLLCKWTKSASAYVTRYRVRWRRNNGQWTDLSATSLNEIDIGDAIPGNYEVLVYPQNGFGGEGQPASGTYALTYTGSNSMLAPLSLVILEP